MFCYYYFKNGYNPGQSIRNRIETSSKTGPVKESLISIYFCVFFFWTAIAKVWYLEWRLSTGLCLHRNWDFPNIFLFPKILREVVQQLVSQLVYQVCYTRYHVSFYFWLIGSVLKHCKVPKYNDRDCSLDTLSVCSVGQQACLCYWLIFKFFVKIKAFVLIKLFLQKTV